MPNHLAAESSPYLLQHADNPVDWYPWGPPALQRARDEDKPIFLSIGYSACHWCHVMERESFVDPDVAAFLNAHFVCIKVDREERPDLDAIYMQAVTALTGGGGWPLSVWLDTDTVPFYGGTYFPPSPRQGMPSFRQVLGAVAGTWADRREELRQGTAQMLRHLTAESADRIQSSRRQTLDEADLALRSAFDPVHGGWGGAPKFPQPLVLEYLLFRQALAPRAQLEPQLRTTLDAMAAGGIYDHLGGGFHRYSTDEYWLVPHFEKMLYDNAQLARCYLHAWQVTGTTRYREVVEQTLDYLLRRMSHPEGGLFSAEDADSEGREGAFYVWTLEQVNAALTVEEARSTTDVYGLTASGDFEGANILHLVADPAGKAVVLAAARDKLQRVRDQRVPPARDEKIVTGWNGLALAALAEAARVLQSDRYREAAQKTGSFIAGALAQPGYRLAHCWKDGRATGCGFLEDHACAIEGLLALYQMEFEERWFELARGLAGTMIERFSRPAGGFYDTSDDHEALIVRPRSVQDSPTPSGNSLAATVLLKLAAYTGDLRYQEAAAGALDCAPAYLARAPMMFGQWLQAYLLDQTGLTHVALVGPRAGTETKALLSALDRRFRPWTVAAARAPGSASAIPLLAGHEPEQGLAAAAWVCREGACLAPTGEPEKLATLLEQLQTKGAGLPAP